MFIASVMIVVGLAVLITGGEWVVQGAKALCIRSGISGLAIGLLAVSFGTSMPELAVNLAASSQGQGALCFGNIMGSNMANIGLVLGIAALIRPLSIATVVVRREIPMLLMASFVAAALGFDRLFSGAPINLFSRGDAVILLLLFITFLYYTMMGIVNDKNHSSIEEAEIENSANTSTSTRKSVAMMLAGFILLAGGGKLTVIGAVDTARILGLSEALIGLTIIAIATSLPELVVSIIAVRKGEIGLAVGNVVGSNIFNLLFIFGLSSLINPVIIPTGEGSLLVMMLFFAVCIWPFAFSHRRKVVRWEGAVLLISYFAYIIWKVISATT